MNQKQHDEIKRQLKYDMKKAYEKNDTYELQNCERALKTLEAIRKTIKCR